VHDAARWDCCPTERQSEEKETGILDERGDIESGTADRMPIDGHCA
jgi:hypothetical protein